MNATTLDTQRSRTTVRSRAGRLRQKRLQSAGLERLIDVLTHAASQASGAPVVLRQIDEDHPHRLGRLQAAHAAYALASSPMQRTGLNGWLCRRAARTVAASRL